MQPPLTPAPASEGKWDFYAAVLAGPKQDYYLAQFRRIDSGKGTWRSWLSWNWGAVLCTFNWLRHRKLRTWSLAYFFVALPAILFAQFIAVAHDRCAAALAGAGLVPQWLPAILLLVNVLFPLFANRLYYENVSSRIAAVQGATEDRSEQIRRLSADGAVAGYGGSVAGMVILAALALGLPAIYGGGYATRAKLAEVILAGASYRAGATDYFHQNKRLPASVNDIGGFSGPTGKVGAVTLEKDGTIKVVANFAPAAGRSILFIPSVQEGKVVWVCWSKDLPDQCLPASCRR